MDMAAVSAKMSQSQLGLDVGVALVNLSKDVMAQQAQALETLIATATLQMEKSVNPQLGRNINIRL